MFKKSKFQLGLGFFLVIIAGLLTTLAFNNYTEDPSGQALPTVVLKFTPTLKVAVVNPKAPLVPVATKVILQPVITKNPNLMTTPISTIIPMGGGGGPAPVLLLPANAALINNPSLTLSWNAVSYATHYRVEVSETTDFTHPEVVEVVYETSVQVNLPCDHLWYWRVIASSTQSYGKPSNVRTFTLDSTPPLPPVLLAPPDGSKSVNTPTFSWKAVADANAYQFNYFSKNKLPASYTSKVVLTTSYKPAAMNGNAIYSWRVRSRDAAGNWGKWSSAWQINITKP